MNMMNGQYMGRGVRMHHDEYAHTHDEPFMEERHIHGGQVAGTDASTEHAHAVRHVHQSTKTVLDRLSRAIGHLTSVRTMVENERDCAEVLIQLAAVRSALNGIAKVILKDHLDHCIVDAVKTGDQETIDELNKAIELLLK